MELLERVRACLLNARLGGSFLLRREGDAIRLDLVWKGSANAIVAALQAQSFTLTRTAEKGALLITPPPPVAP